MGDEGLEQTAETNSKTADSVSGGHTSGHIAADSDLQTVIDAWRNLSETVRQHIMAKVQERGIGK